MAKYSPLSLLVLMLFAGCSKNSGQTSATEGPAGKMPVPAQQETVVTSTPLPTFSGEHAFTLLTAQTAFGPRNPNSAGHRACLTYIASTLRGLADDVRLQEFTHTGYGGEQLHLTNIIARFRPSDSTRILLCAHWDTRPRAEQDETRGRRNDPILGANDGASGVAVLLEIAGLLKITPPFIGVDIVLFDGEDYGREGDHASYLLGSRYFAEHKGGEYIPRFGILLDMVGDKFLELPKEQYSLRYAPHVVDMVWKTAAFLGVHQFLDEKGEEIMDDHLPLNEAGIQTIDIIDFNYPDASNRFWHTHQDTPEHCSAESLEAVGSVIASVVYAQVP
jgi:glutaminyl-peptide cyclotransferase